MLRATASAAGGLLVATSALAAADIPTRYSGSFPSTALTTNITGTFTGKSLILKYTFKRKRVTANYSCVQSSQYKTNCTGRARADDGQFSAPSGVEISWLGGRPVWVHFAKRK
jgi:hypothetical protein